MRLIAALLLGALLAAPSVGQAEPIRVYAAGSLRAVITEIGRAFEAAHGTAVTAKFGPSGLLRDELMTGGDAHVFASANMDHPRSLRAADRSGPVVLFARNRLCALVRPGFDVGPETLVERMLDPAVKLGTSTPKADPSGDYAWEVFRKIERLRPGAFGALERKALQLTGGSSSPSPPAGRSVYAGLIEQGRADLFLTYCTNSVQAERQVPGARTVALPDAVAVGADYGLTVLNGSPIDAYRFALFVLSPEGQAIVARAGFDAPNQPQ